jgi:hypothetical protein
MQVQTFNLQFLSELAWTWNFKSCLMAYYNFKAGICAMPMLIMLLLRNFLEYGGSSGKIINQHSFVSLTALTLVYLPLDVPSSRTEGLWLMSERCTLVTRTPALKYGVTEIQIKYNLKDLNTLTSLTATRLTSLPLVTHLLWARQYADD